MRNFTKLLLLIIPGILFTISACVDKLKSQNDFLIPVDSVQIPEVITANTPFDIKFFGTIGANGCHSFKTFNRTIKKNEIIIEAWGTFDDKEADCPQVMVTLDGQILNMTIPNPGIYLIRISEPYDFVLVKQITVKQQL